MLEQETEETRMGFPLKNLQERFASGSKKYFQEMDLGSVCEFNHAAGLRKITFAIFILSTAPTKMTIKTMVISHSIKLGARASHQC